MPSITDWIQTAVVVAGLGLAVNELFLRQTLSEKQKKQSTLHFIEQSGSSEVLVAVKKMIGYRQAQVPTPVWTIVADIAPYTQYLEALATCYDNALCSEDLTRSFACEKLKTYEMSVVSILSKYSNPVANAVLKDRNLKETQLWEDCPSDET